MVSGISHLCVTHILTSVVLVQRINVCMSVNAHTCTYTLCFCTPIGADHTITPASSTYTIAMGTTQACIDVSAVSDNIMEPEETFAISWEPTLSYVNFVTSNETTFTIRERKCVHVCTCALTAAHEHMASYNDMAYDMTMGMLHFSLQDPASVFKCHHIVLLKVVDPNHCRLA